MFNINKKDYSFKAWFIILLIMIMSFVFVVFAYTNEELREIYITRDEAKVWIQDQASELAVLEINGQAKVQKEVMYQMWVRGLKDQNLETISSSEMQSMEERWEKEYGPNRTTPAPTETSPGGGYVYIDWNSVTTDSTNWMSNIPDNRYVHELNIPGTHDSATQYVKNGNTLIDMFAAAATCQDKSIQAQLNAGIRAFDFRVDESLNLCHGDGSYKFTAYSDSGKTTILTLQNALNTISSFLSSHSSETVLVSIKKEDGDTATVRTAVQNLLTSYTSDTMYTGSTWPTIGNVRGKMVLVTRISSLGQGLYYNVPDNTSSTMTVNGVTIYTEDHYDASADDKKTHVGNAFTTSGANTITTDGTKGSNGALTFTSSNTFSSSTLTSYQSPQAIAAEVNPYIASYTLTQGKLYGQVMMDFVTEELAMKIYKTNP
jgi:1-phosphatidylinositol phosphodiesterase